MNNNIILSLNQFWTSLGITEFSFLAFLKIIFLILFLLLNIGLLYCEYLNNKSKINNGIMNNGVGGDVRKILAVFTGAGAAYASWLKIKNEHFSSASVELYKFRSQVNTHASDIKNLKDKNLSDNLGNDLNINGLKLSFDSLYKIKKDTSEVESKFKDLDGKFKNGDKSIKEETLTQLQAKLEELKRKESRAIKEVDDKLKSAVKYSDDTIKESDNNKIIDIIKGGDKKSSLFYLDELLTNFESLNGILKLVVYMIFSSSIILWCLFGILLNLYGNYLIDKFNLEYKYPKIALFINYRKKISKYYIISNYLIIIIMCLLNIVLGISIFSLKLK